MGRSYTYCMFSGVFVCIDHANVFMSINNQVVTNTAEIVKEKITFKKRLKVD